MRRILRRSGLTRRFILGVVVALSASLAVLVGTSSPASAAASFRCGTDFPWGPFCQVTFDRQTSLTAKQMLVQGAGPGAVATWLCKQAPWFVTVTCVFAAAKDGAEFRDAVNEAKNSPIKCVAIRVYQVAASRDIARGISAVDCYPTGGGSGGGAGGGGGGGSWRGETGGGGSW
jgi:hypothetical protein